MTTFDFKAKNWRDYQKKLRRHKKRRVILQKLPLTGTIIGCVFLFIISFFWAGSWIFANLRTEKKPGIEGYTKDPLPPSYTKEDLPDLLSGFKLEVSPVTGDYIIACDGSGLTISTSLDTALQNYIKRVLER